jgi:hypothetical protein
MSAHPDPQPDGLAFLKADTLLPHPARLYDYMIGGREHLPAERAAADELLAMNPDARRAFMANRLFLGRVVQYLIGQGVRQFLDIGAGLPAGGAVHEVAHAIAPDTRVVYVDFDEIVLAQSRALVGSDRVRIVPGNAIHPQAILDDPVVRSFIDWEEPVGLLMVALLHFVPEPDGPHRIVATFRDALPPGSFLAISHGNVEGWEHVKEQARLTANTWLRSIGEIGRMFDGFEMVEPGLVNVASWRPADGEDTRPVPVYGGVGRLASGA